MQKNYLQQALKALRPDAPNWYGWAKEDADGNVIPASDRMTYANTIVVEEGVAKPTEEEVSTEIARLQILENRENAYPSIQEQLDMQYWDSVNGTTTWADAIAKVKADYPKGAE